METSVSAPIIFLQQTEQKAERKEMKKTQEKKAKKQTKLAWDRRHDTQTKENKKDCCKKIIGKAIERDYPLRSSTNWQNKN